MRKVSSLNIIIALFLLLTTLDLDRKNDKSESAGPKTGVYSQKILSWKKNSLQNPIERSERMVLNEYDYGISNSLIPPVTPVLGKNKDNERILSPESTPSVSTSTGMRIISPQLNRLLVLAKIKCKDFESSKAQPNTGVYNDGISFTFHHSLTYWF